MSGVRGVLLRNRTQVSGRDETGPTNARQAQIEFASEGAGLRAAVAIVIAVGVIPPVLSDTFSQAAPKGAAIAFEVLSVMNLIFAASIGIMGYRVARRRRLTLWPAVPVLLVLTFALGDAASDLAGHGSPLHLTAILLHVC